MMKIPSNDPLSMLANAVCKDASHAAVKCVRCGANFPASREDIARYFASGWPVCCGETAMLSTRRG